MIKGDILELDINSIGMEGEGVARLENFVIFIPGALVGERVKVQITEVKKSFAHAKVIKVITPSKHRITPLCPIFFRCGGCEMQHVDYEYQLNAKRDNIINCFRKTCKIDVNVDQVVTGEKKFGYRNKVQIPIRTINGKATAGFYKVNSHFFVPFEKSTDKVFGDCPLHTREMQNIVDCVVNYVNDYKISTYDEIKNSGIVRHLVLRRVGSTYSICMVINSKQLSKSEELINRLKQLKIEFSLYISINLQRTNVILGDKLICLYGQEKVQGEALGVKFSVNPYSFLQVNDDIRDAIYNRVNDIVSKVPNAKVVDAYSGIGILSNIMASSADKVVGVEIIPEAIKDANKLAQINNHKNITNICGDAAAELPKVIKNFNGKGSIVVIDPPRKGCDAPVLQSILNAEPEKIIYISCNPATLARDASILLEKYSIESITPYDMFPQTTHVETLICLLKKS